MMWLQKQSKTPMQPRVEQTYAEYGSPQSMIVHLTRYRYWQLFLSQGLCTGIGNGLIFCPSLALLSTYFSSKRALAIGFAASGSATGGLVFPVIVQQLLPKIGFGWTVRVLGFVMLLLQVVAFVFTKPRMPPRKTGPLVELAAFRELPYTLFSVGMFLSFWGLYFAFYYIGSFGRDILGIGQQGSINNLLSKAPLYIPTPSMYLEIRSAVHKNALQALYIGSRMPC